MAIAEEPRPEAQAAAAEVEQRVTALELFFDLVFVFAITQVTAYISVDPTWSRLIEGMAILTAVWWAWGSYAWLGNQAGSDDGLFRVTLLAAMAAMAVAAIAVPRAFGADALAFGIAYCAVRILHIAAYAALARRDPNLTAVVARLARSMVPAGLMFVLAGLVDEGTAFDKAFELAKRIATNAPLTNYALMHALPRIAEQSADHGFFTEALISGIVQAAPEAKARVRDFLEGRGAKVSKG